MSIKSTLFAIPLAVVTLAFVACNSGGGGGSGGSGDSDSTPGTDAKAPANPITNLNAVGGDTVANLSWNLTGDNTRYDELKVEWKASTASDYNAPITLPNKTDTSYQITGLSNGTAYDIRAFASNSAGDSEKSDVVQVTPVATIVPNPFSSIQATPGNAEITLSWTLTGDASRYDELKVEYKLASASTYGAPITLPNKTDTSYKATGLTNGQAYDFRLFATDNSNGDSAKASIKATPKAPPPDNPVSALAAVAGDARVTLSWKLTAGSATSYDSLKVQYKLATDTNYTTPSTQPNKTDTSYQITGLTNDSLYDFRLFVTHNTNGDSTPVSIKATPNPIANPVTGLAAVAGSGVVNLSWDLTGDASLYDKLKVEWKASTASDYGAPTTLPNKTDTSYQVTGLTDNQAYDFRLFATSDSLGDSLPSATVQATPVATSVPNPFTNVRATAGDTEITLSWTLSGDASLYDKLKVEWKASTASDYGAAITLPNKTDTSYKATGLTNGQAYDFRLFATDDTNGDSPKASITATPVKPPPANPVSGFTATATDTGMALSWTLKAGSATTYDALKVQHKRASDPLSALPTATTLASKTATSHTITGLDSDTAYDFYIFVSSTAGGDSTKTTTQGTTRIANPIINLAAVAGGTTVNLSWSLTGDNTRYDSLKVEYKLATASTYTTPTAQPSKTDTSYQVSGLTIGSRYDFRVFASHNTKGDAPKVSIQATTTIDNPVINLAATAGDTLIDLAWDLTGDASTYDSLKVEYKLASASNYTTKTLTKDKTSDQITGLTNNQAYDIRVFATSNTLGDSLPVTATATPASSPLAAFEGTWTGCYGSFDGTMGGVITRAYYDGTIVISGSRLTHGATGNYYGGDTTKKCSATPDPSFSSTDKTVYDIVSSASFTTTGGESGTRVELKIVSTDVRSFNVGDTRHILLRIDGSTLKATDTAGSTAGLRGRTFDSTFTK